MNSINNLSSIHALDLLDNAVLAWALIACGLAQLMKLFFEFFQYRKWRPEVLFETGGMPSSHSAFVTGTAAGVGWQMGFNNSEFALAVTVAFVVMYDASGIRRAAGLTAKRVNLLPLSIWKNPPEEQLKESLGHSRSEVLIGSLIGPAIALPGLVFLGSPLHLAERLGMFLR